MNETLRQFLTWEKNTRQAVDFKPIYADMTNDLLTGLNLSQLIYWCILPDRWGRSKLRVDRAGHLWLAKRRNQWWDEIRMSPKQIDRSIGILLDLGLVAKGYWMFSGKRTTHLRICWDAFYDAWRANLPREEEDLLTIGTNQRDTRVSTNGKQRSSPKGKSGIDEKGRPITETTKESTSEITTDAAAAASVMCSIHKVPMERRTKNGDVWYSHRLEDGSWCKGEPGDQPGDTNRQSNRRRNVANKTVRCPSCSLTRAADWMCPDCGMCYACCTCYDAKSEIHGSEPQT
jgi:hypothetical protein